MEIPFADAAKTSIVRRGVIVIATEKDYSRKWRPIAPSNTLRLRTCRPARDETFSWRSRTLMLLLPGTARRGVTLSQKQIIPASNAPTQSMVPQQYFTPASVSPNTRWDLLMKIPYADSATTLHSLTGCNIIATEADYPRKQRARLLEQYLPLCICCPKRDGTLP